MCIRPGNALQTLPGQRPLQEPRDPRPLRGFIKKHSDRFLQWFLFFEAHLDSGDVFGVLAKTGAAKPMFPFRKGAGEKHFNTATSRLQHGYFKTPTYSQSLEVSSGVEAMIVPGSGLVGASQLAEANVHLFVLSEVKKQAEAEGLDKIFTEADLTRSSE